MSLKLHGRFLKIFVLVLIHFFGACVVNKDYVYFQSAPVESSHSKKSVKNNIKLQVGDIISIQISAMDPDVVKPFNSNFDTKANPAASTSDGFLIRQDGTIDFPILGKLNLEGSTTDLAANVIKDKLKTYIKDPIVNIRIVNFKITILGDVKMPGVYYVSNERITILEALGLAGDLNISGLRKNILLVRDNAGKTTETRIDLTSNNVFRSPVYFLQQNDVLYVEPNQNKINSNSSLPKEVSVAIGFTALFFNVLNLFKK